MTAAILSIIAALIPFAIWWYKRRAARLDSPEQTRDDIHKAISDGNQDEVNRLLDDGLRRTPPRRDDRLRDKDSRESNSG